MKNVFRDREEETRTKQVLLRKKRKKHERACTERNIARQIAHVNIPTK